MLYLMYLSLPVTFLAQKIYRMEDNGMVTIKS